MMIEKHCELLRWRRREIKTACFKRRCLQKNENGIFIEIGNGLLKIFQAVCQIVKTGELVKALYSQKIWNARAWLEVLFLKLP